MDSIYNIFLNKSFDGGDKSSLNYAYEFLFSNSTCQCSQLRNQFLTVVNFSMSVNCAMATRLTNHTK